MVHLFEECPFCIEVAVHVLLLQTVTNLEVFEDDEIDSDSDVCSWRHNTNQILLAVAHGPKFVLDHGFKGVNRSDLGCLLIDQVTTFPDEPNRFVDHLFGRSGGRVSLTLC